MKRAARLRTLYLYANGVGARVVAIDTLLRGMLRLREGDRPVAALHRFTLVQRAYRQLRDRNERLSYMHDWKAAFAAHAALQVEKCNINDLVSLARCLLRIRAYDVVVVAHSAAGDDMSLLSRISGALQRRRGRLVVFIGNEYDILDDKIRFIRNVGAEFVCSQLPLEAARYLYEECAGSRILEMPHALNPGRYRRIPGVACDIDVGFIGDIYWPFVGDRERTDLIEWFERHGAAHGLAVDIRRERVSAETWNIFLNRCKAVIGAESGTYYLNERGRLLDRARAYNLRENRAASFDEVYRRFYAGQPRSVSGKSISSRHFEPIGAKTCQILVEGHYNGILRPHEHYIPVRRDLSDIDQALEQFRDDRVRREMVERAYEHVMAHHTYAHRVERLLQSVAN